jgi:hypothetical protein
MRGTASFPSGGQRSAEGELGSPWKCPVYGQEIGKRVTRRDTRFDLIRKKDLKSKLRTFRRIG